ncbi:MAG: hypothetical protein K0R54_1082 [Clostridiaceae bacterium]|jgi:hypothetical protein|nr:hypothetical protein [Clostridiaceae bacterium]
MNKEILQSLNYISYSASELDEYKQAEKNIEVNFEGRKKSLKGKIILANIINNDEYVSKGLSEGETLIDMFKATSTPASFFANMGSFDYKYIPYIFRDIGQYYTVYLTNKNLIIIETNRLQKFKKGTFFNLKDILSFRYKKKPYGYKFVFRFKHTDKYEFRDTYFMNTSYFKYYYRMKVSGKNALYVAEELDAAINQ